MSENTNQIKKPLGLFIAAAAITFGFITLLQFMSMPWLAVVLVAMHVGIALFIVSKRIFKNLGLDVKRFYNTQYVLLLPYLLVMFYTFAAKAGLLPLFASEKTTVVLVYSAVCVLVTVWNYLRMKSSLTQQMTSNNAQLVVE